MFAWRVIARTQTSGKRHGISACRDPHRVGAASELHAVGKGADCGRGIPPRRDREGRGPAVRDPRKPAVSVAPPDESGISGRWAADLCAVDGNVGAGRGGIADFALETPSPAASTAVAGAILEIMLPDGARVRLEGAVDPTLAAAVLRALTISGRTP